MPELPDITIYLEALERRVVGQPLIKVRIAKPFLLRTVEPPLSTIEGKKVLALHRLGKRIAFEFEDEHYLIIHLMIAGRFRWIDAGGKVPGKIGLAGFDFPNGTLVLTEAGTKRRAGMWMVKGSSEILHRARMSPMKLSGKLSDQEVAMLFDATRSVLVEWTERLRAETGDGFPGKVTAFRKEMAVHGKYGQPCPVCGSPVQRIRYADNETNYCARCQTEGRLFADRGLSRLLKQDWPKSLDEIENGK